MEKKYWKSQGILSAWKSGSPAPIPVDRMTDTCKNITLPQLRCGR